jgi:hypothetical protein
VRASSINDGRNVIGYNTTEIQAMLTNSKIALSIAIVLATASAAAAAPHKSAVHHQTATARHLPAASYLRTGSARFSGNESCYFKFQTIGNEDSNGFTPTNYNCRRVTRRS